jgi:hypothetical protein
VTGIPADAIAAAVEAEGIRAGWPSVSRGTMRAIAATMLAAAAPLIAAAERERIRQLAITRKALYLAGGVPDDGQPSGLMPFADLLEDPPATTPGGTA